MKLKAQRHIEHANALGQVVKIWFTSKTIYGENSYQIKAIGGKEVSSCYAFEWLEHCLKYSESEDVQNQIINKTQ